MHGAQQPANGAAVMQSVLVIVVNREMLAYAPYPAAQDGAPAALGLVKSPVLTWPQTVECYHPTIMRGLALIPLYAVLA
jgi:hypothetical protein